MERDSHKIYLKEIESGKGQYLYVQFLPRRGDRIVVYKIQNEKEEYVVDEISHIASEGWAGVQTVVFVYKYE